MQSTTGNRPRNRSDETMQETAEGAAAGVVDSALKMRDEVSDKLKSVGVDTDVMVDAPRSRSRNCSASSWTNAGASDACARCGRGRRTFRRPDDGPLADAEGLHPAGGDRGRLAHPLQDRGARLLRRRRRGGVPRSGFLLVALLIWLSRSFSPLGASLIIAIGLFVVAGGLAIAARFQQPAKTQSSPLSSVALLAAPAALKVASRGQLRHGRCGGRRRPRRHRRPSHRPGRLIPPRLFVRPISRVARHFAGRRISLSDPLPESRLMAIPFFMFATGIENSAPTIDNGRVRMDEMEKCFHYKYWEEDIALTAELGIPFLRYGPQLHRTLLGPDRFDWSFADKAFAKIYELDLVPIVDLCHFGVPDWIGNFQNPDFPRSSPITRASSPSAFPGCSSTRRSTRCSSAPPSRLAMAGGTSSSPTIAPMLRR